MCMKLRLNLGKRSYDVIIKAGALQNVGKLINLNRKVLIVTDSGVPKEYAQNVQKQCENGYIFTVEQGEASKSIETYSVLLRQMIKHNFTRKDAVIAVGGGVVGDLAGFVASSYMRGVDFINCPTTTLAQIDSSIGGKVAVNLDDTKNIVGAFHQPKLVVIDTDTLKTLSKRQYAQGLAEALKAGLIASKELFELFENGEISQNIEQIIYKSLYIKKQIVEEDETESGVRAALNFGHTIGHGIESACGLGQLYHGECVGLGMLYMIEDNKLKHRTRAILKKLNLPTKTPCAAQDIFKYVCHDKKAGANNIKIVKVSNLGEFRFDTVSFEDVKKIIEIAI